MFQRRLLVLCFVTLTTVVTAHVGHGDDVRRKAIDDALLSYLCQGANGFPCNGHGSCSGGTCTCFQGYSGLKCEKNNADLNFGMQESGLIDLSQPGVTFRHPPRNDLHLHDLLTPPTDGVRSDYLACFNGEENTCSGNGVCQGGTCVCESGYSGLLCELSAETGFCRTYKDCAECTAFMEPCPERCHIMAKFKLVFGFPKVPSGSPNFKQCRFRSSTLNCTYYFKQESEDEYGNKVIMVKACLATLDSATNFTESVEQVKDTMAPPMTESTQPTATVRTTATLRTTVTVRTPQPGTDPHDDHIHPPDEDTGDTGKQSNTGTGDGKGAGTCTRPELFVLSGCLLICLKLFTEQWLTDAM